MNIKNYEIIKMSIKDIEGILFSECGHPPAYTIEKSFASRFRCDICETRSPETKVKSYDTEKLLPCPACNRKPLILVFTSNEKSLYLEKYSYQITTTIFCPCQNIMQKYYSRKSQKDAIEGVASRWKEITNMLLNNPSELKSWLKDSDVKERIEVYNKYEKTTCP